MPAAKLGLVEGQPRELLALGSLKHRCLVVEAGDGDAALAVAQRGQDAHQGVGGVLDHAPEAARMEVLARPRDIDLEVHVAAQRDGQGRVVALVEAGVGDDHDVAVEAIACWP